MELKIWLVYLLAVIGLSLTPGPNSLLVLAHGALHGRARTLWTIGGGALGFAALIGLSMLGIGALLQSSAHALTVMKWVGGAYLVWLGIQLWRAPAMQLEALPAGAGERAVTGGRLFRQGLLAAISNPKVLLFYGAFLPQFITPGRDLWLQFVVMAGTFAIVECLVEFGLASLAHRIRPWLQRTGKKFNRSCGVLFGLMGAALPMTH
ncbi:threonine/homoserine/homoserine lactone efflux protein [Acidovorax soli]|uniref:Threonine/homoserine/homoserine lactone efflux protein n=1 Tax=Acidovorax soli TaxID=592050 RepID=A0A7X0PGR1_9BURK|nr:LysE family transporter [Acidovorax soli]MBB6561640.1 threonine/homoserine/homoserine lactone efflux protein [Acidovorax soli]